MTLKLREVAELYSALKSLDGTDRVVHVENQPDKVVREPFFFGGKTRWNIAKNLGILKHSIDAYEVARTDLIKSLSKDGAGIAVGDTEAFGKFNVEHEKMLNAVEDLSGILKLSEDELNTDKNPIPPSVLMVLLPLIAV